MANDLRERDEPIDPEVGARDFKFGVTGILLAAGAAILMAIIFGGG